jgi:hypothetical protein
MRKTLSASIVALAVCAGLASARTQSPQAAQTQPPQASQTITVSGCVQKETDVIKSSQAAGNIGLGDEFVLTHSKVMTGSQPPKAHAPEPQVPPAPTDTSGAGDTGKVYRVTGDKEKELKDHVGQRVEITGKFKHEADARRELGAIGTSGKPPAATGELTTGNTPEITIESIKMTAASCSPQVK